MMPILENMLSHQKINSNVIGYKERNYFQIISQQYKKMKINTLTLSKTIRLLQFLPFKITNTYFPPLHVGIYLKRKVQNIVIANIIGNSSRGF